MENLTNQLHRTLFAIIILMFLGFQNVFSQTFAVTIIPGSTKCTHGTDGILTANPSGGSAPYTFLWSNSLTTQTINNLAPGIYTITVTDIDGASVTNSYHLYSCCTGAYLIEGDIQLSTLVGLPFVVPSGNSAIVFTNFNCNPGLPYNTVALNGTLHIDMPCYFSNLEMVCGPDAEIIVDPTVQLSMSDGCNYLHACGQRMWQGITLTGSLQGQPALVIGADTWIEDADDAVVSNSDAEYSINNATFNKNHFGVVVNGIGNPNPSIINHTTFASNVLNTNGTLGAPDVCLPPYAGKRSKKGVELNGVGPMTVGSTNAIYGQPNTFRNLDYGIYIDSRYFSSIVTIVNNNFVDIPFISTNTYDNGWGIWCTSAIGFSLFQVSTLNIGGFNSKEPNTFTDCHGGILSQGNTQSTVANNTFTRCPDNAAVSSTYNGAAIRFRRADRPSDITVEYNYINNCNRGIHFINVQNSPVQIRFNEINNPPNNIWNTFGISAVNVFPAHGPGSVFIRDNQIRYCRTGINLTNNGVTHVETNNHIRFTYNNTSSVPSNVRYGVRVQGAAGNNIVGGNTIERTGTVNPTINFEDHFFGVSVETSDENTVTNNTIIRMGDAIRFSNVLAQTVTCNDMQNSFNGMKLDNADIGNQYIDPNGTAWAQDNQWNTYFGNCIKGIGSLYATEFNTQSTSYPTPYYPSPLDQFPMSQYPFPNAPSQNGCSLSPSCPDCDRERMAAIINEEGDFLSLSLEQQYTAKKNVFFDLAMDTTKMYFGDNYDLIFRNFYDSAMTGNFGELLSIYNHISDNENTQASAINSSFNPDNNMELNEQMLNEIYLVTWAVGIYELNEDQYDILYNIAIQNPTTGGLAVYGARVMLDLEVDDITTEGGRFLNPDSGTTDNETHETIIVNSSFNSLYYSLDNGLTGTFSLYNLFGQLILKKQLLARENKIEINSSQFPSGTYFYSVASSNDIIENGKVIIIK